MSVHVLRNKECRAKFKETRIILCELRNKRLVHRNMGCTKDNFFDLKLQERVQRMEELDEIMGKLESSLIIS